MKTAETSGTHNRQDQCSQSGDQDVNRIAQVELPDLADQQVPDCQIERTPEHIHG